MGITEPRMPTDHRMVLGKLIREGVRRHCSYFEKRVTWPITAGKGVTVQEGGSYFNDLKQMVKKPSRKTRTTTAPWISYATWRIADQRMAMGRKLVTNQQERRTVT